MLKLLQVTDVMAKMVLAAFSDRQHADMAVDELIRAGYDPEEISVISKENKDDMKEMGGQEASDRALKGAGEGAATGGAIGGIAGLLAGAGIFPALAGLMIGGPIAVALGLTGAAATTVSGAVTGAVAGGLIGALTGLGINENKAETYDEIVNDGGLIVGAPVTDSSPGSPKEIFESHHAEEIDTVDYQEA